MFFSPPVILVRLFAVTLLFLFSGLARSESAQVSIISPNDPSTDCVILLHGLARTADSMDEMSRELQTAGYHVAIVDYPSRKYRIEALSEDAVGVGIEACEKTNSTRLYFVTHSMGGILIRYYLSVHEVPQVHRIVMLAPPNHGSSVVDNMKEVPGVSWLNGPAFLQLGTDENSVPLSLGEIEVETAVIAGTRSVNLILSNFLENPDDGKVSLKSARLEGMCAMLALEVSHPFIMKDEQTIEQVLSYLKTGRFTLDTAEYLDC